jgi:hypothetical protein
MVEVPPTNTREGEECWPGTSLPIVPLPTPETHFGFAYVCAGAVALTSSISMRPQSASCRQSPQTETVEDLSETVEADAAASSDSDAAPAQPANPAANTQGSKREAFPAYA